MYKKFSKVWVIMKTNIKIIDNFLDKEVFKRIQNFILNKAFTWFYSESKVNSTKIGFSPIKGYEGENPHQFTHTVINTQCGPYWSSVADQIKPLLNKINPRFWIRIKLNLSSINSKPIVGGWHHDLSTGDNRIPWTDTTTAIFYINTNNGYTMFENGEKISCLENRLAIFPNNLMHTGVSQTDTKRKVTLNLNYLKYLDKGI